MTPPPVVLLHGWGGSSASTFGATEWFTTFANQGIDAVGIDLPGHAKGASRDPDTYQDMAGLVERGLPSGTIDLLGYSLGAKIALEIAVHRPDQVRRLVLIGVGDNAFVREPAADPVIEALEEGVDEATPAGARAFVAYTRLGGGDPLALAAVLRRRANPIADPSRLGELGKRTLLINGSDDRLAIPDAQLRVALPGHTYVLVEGLDHLAMVADPAVCKASTAFFTASEETHSEERALAG